MTLRAVTFDCADTLLRSHWHPSRWAVRWAEEAGIAVNRELAALEYDKILHQRWAEFQNLNLQRSQEVCDAFWLKLTEDWLVILGEAKSGAQAVMELAARGLFLPNGGVFEEFDDVRACLEQLSRDGLKLAVISNWDVSLHRVLAGFGLTDCFDLVVASLEEGVEKPDPRLFHLTLKRLGVAPEEALHIGDNPIDDLEGARGAGMTGLLIDRTRPATEAPFLKSLGDLQEVLKSIA